MIGVDLTVLDGVQQLAGLGVDALEGGSEGHPGVARAAPDGDEGLERAHPVVVARAVRGAGTKDG